MAEPKPPDAATWVPSASDPQKLRAWARERKLEVDGIHGVMTLRNSLPSKDDVELLSKRLNALEWADDPARVRTILIGELEETLHGAWCYYLQEQAKLDRAREAREREARRRQLKQKAAQAAVKYRNQHARTSGTVVTGLVDLETGNVYVGQSGTGNRITPTLHPVMYELLGGSGPVAQWPTDVCGEVNVMNEYLHKSNFTSASQIPANSLVFHSETFNSGGTVINKKTGKPTVKTPHWESRGACKNCEKWITRIGAETA
ncbi:YwqJ-related putative deaminase [Sphaerimonospora mesophila]|uniref:YwqJ-related putative deaminase n=1 Tax=Sphaerimonospora mesophila TaxID=37483 RepID=UPI0006E19AA6